MNLTHHSIHSYLAKGVVGILLFGSLIPAIPQTNKTPTVEKHAGDSVSEQKQLALARLESIGERAKQLDPGVSKVNILTRVADALWAHNESRARQLFLAAFESIDQVTIDANSDQRSRTGAFGLLFHLRANVLEMIAKRDTEWANELRRSLLDSLHKNPKAKALSQDEMLELELVATLGAAKTHPERAAAFIKNFVREHGSEKVIWQLMGLRRNEPMLADRLFNEMLASLLSSRKLWTNLTSLTGYVIGEQESELFANPLSTGIATMLPLLEAVSLALESARDDEISQQTYSALASLLPFFEKYRPQSLSLVQHLLQDWLRRGYDRQKTRLVSSEQLDELVRRAETAVGERHRTAAFLRASTAAITRGDYERALSLAERIDDLRERSLQVSLVHYNFAVKQLRLGDTARAYRAARQIEFLPQRVAIVIRLADKLWQEKKVTRSQAMLTELFEWLIKRESSPQKADALLTLTGIMAKRNRATGFEWLENAVRAINGTDFTYKPPLANPVTMELHITLDMLDFETSFTALAAADFERAFLLAGMLAKPEATLLAKTIVCRQVMDLR